MEWIRRNFVHYLLMLFSWCGYKHLVKCDLILGWNEKKGIPCFVRDFCLFLCRMLVVCLDNYFPLWLTWFTFSLFLGCLAKDHFPLSADILNTLLLFPFDLALSVIVFMFSLNITHDRLLPEAQIVQNPNFVMWAVTQYSFYFPNICSEFTFSFLHVFLTICSFNLLLLKILLFNCMFVKIFRKHLLVSCSCCSFWHAFARSSCFYCC